MNLYYWTDEINIFIELLLMFRNQQTTHPPMTIPHDKQCYRYT